VTGNADEVEEDGVVAADATLPIGYLVDSGKPFHVLAGGTGYGWSKDNTGATAERGRHPNPLRDTLILYSAVEPPIPTQTSANIDDGDVTRRTHLVKSRMGQKLPADDADERRFGTLSASICVIRGQLLFLG